jgi:mRNA-degrading endonuclease YafQ of YafQ-DinJ toxin-antitoxin module
MINLKFTPHFKKAYKKLVRKNPDCAFDILNSLLHFTANPFDSRLETHKLSGDKKDLWSFTVQYDMRIIFGLNRKIPPYWLISVLMMRCINFIGYTHGIHTGNTKKILGI